MALSSLSIGAWLCWLAIANINASNSSSEPINSTPVMESSSVIVLPSPSENASTVPLLTTSIPSYATTSAQGTQGDALSTTGAATPALSPVTATGDNGVQQTATTSFIDPATSSPSLVSSSKAMIAADCWLQLPTKENCKADCCNTNGGWDDIMSSVNISLTCFNHTSPYLATANQTISVGCDVCHSKCDSNSSGMIVSISNALIASLAVGYLFIWSMTSS